MLATPVFQANALLQVEAKKNDLLGFSDVSSMLGKESPSATEIELIKSRAVIGKTVDELKLAILIEPEYFPVIGGFLARRFKNTNPGEVSSPWLGLTRYAWGGELLKITHLDLPPNLLAKKLTFITGEGGAFTLLDDDDELLAQGQVGEAVEQHGVALFVEALQCQSGDSVQHRAQTSIDQHSGLSGGAGCH